MVRVTKKVLLDVKEKVLVRVVEKLVKGIVTDSLRLFKRAFHKVSYS